jgi:hypothetical protein
MKNIKFIAIALSLILSIGVADLSAQTRKKSRKKPILKRTTVTKTAVVTKPVIKLYTVDKESVIRVRINKELSSKTAKVGDTFTTTVTEPVYSNTGVVVIPVGSSVIGRVDTVTPAAKGGKPGSIDISFIQVKTPNGIKHIISGDLTELETKGATSDNEGTASGNKMKHRKVILIGGGAGAGAVLGGLIGGGLGTAIGAGAGAGAGILADRWTKGPEADVKANTEFGVYLNKEVALPKFVEPIE